MMVTLYLSDPQTGIVFSAYATDVDAGGQLTDPALADAIREGGWGHQIVRDFGLGANQWRVLRGGFGWGRSLPRS